MKGNTMPPTYFVAVLLISIILNFAFPIQKINLYPYSYFGAMLIVFGVIVNVWVDALLKKSRTTVKPLEMPTSLEIKGPFRISRHPMYLGMAAILLGVAVVLGSLITFVFSIAFIVLMDKMFISIEEKNLEMAFGNDYLNYKKKVRRWI